jgi:phosphatidylserine/phosphatidylglycerophosphate/cardiolipin synthase-like enzyme
MAPYLNDKHYDAFKDAWVDVKWSDPLNYSLNHSKLLIIDEKAYISTGNFSYSLFKYNRDFLVSFTQREFLESLQQLFLQDFEHKKIWIYHENLVLSPNYSRDKLTYLIENAQESIDFYFPYIADDDFTDIMFSASARWIEIRGIVEKDTYNEDADIIENFQNNNITLYPIKKNKLHAKAILVDDTYLYIGSINFSRYSFDENREIGVIISDQKIIDTFKQVFNSDF